MAESAASTCVIWQLGTCNFKLSKCCQGFTPHKHNQSLCTCIVSACTVSRSSIVAEASGTLSTTNSCCLVQFQVLQPTESINRHALLPTPYRCLLCHTTALQKEVRHQCRLRSSWQMPLVRWMSCRYCTCSVCVLLWRQVRFVLGQAVLIKGGARLQEQAQCAEQVASQVDAALQQAHRSLGYSLQEPAAERDLDHRHHRHLKASAAARGPAGGLQSPLCMTASGLRNVALKIQRTQG